MAFDLTILGGTLIGPDGEHGADIGVRDGKIVAIGDLIGQVSRETVSARGLWVLPGVIDTQVHFREPGLTHKEDLSTGSAAAVLGGVTTYLEMPNTDPTTTSADQLSDKLARAAGRSWANYGFFVGATTSNAEELAHLEMLPGTPGVKIFMGSSTGPLLVSDDADLRRVLASGIRRCPIHSEDEPRNKSRRAEYEAGSMDPDPSLGYGLSGGAADHPHIRDAASARIATERILAISRETGRPVHILHLSTADEIPVIERAKRDGLGTTVEITPQHLWFAAPDCYRRLGAKAQMNPPIRSESHRSALRAALKAGFFDVVGSDHAPHTLDEKAQAFPASPSGMPGVQTLLSAMLALDLVSPYELVRLACENPAELYGIAGKGRISPGYDADLVLIDPKPFKVERDWLASKCGWSPYEGENLFGKPVHTLVGGEWAVRDCALHGTPHGKAATYTWK